MGKKQVWLITGAARGMGADIARAALGAGHAVVATARRVEAITAELGEHADLLAVALDVTDAVAADAAAAAAVERFGRLDVVVNNAGSFHAGFFEELSPESFRIQVETTLLGPVNVTRAALPQMRAQHSGLVVTVSSTAGVTAAGQFMSAYAASKFGVEGFMEALTEEVAPFGVHTMLVVPGFVRTEFLTTSSTQYAEASIPAYDERRAQMTAGLGQMNGNQMGDPVKLADAVLHLAALDQPPLRFIAGADAVGAVEAKAQLLLDQVEAHRELSNNLAFDEV